MCQNAHMNKINKKSVLISVLVIVSACSRTSAPSSQPVVDTRDDQVDLIIMGDYVVSMDDSGSVYEDGAVAIDDGLILAVGPAKEIAAEYSSTETLAGENRIVMPGLINGHSQAAMTLLRGVADDLALMDWLNNYIFPA